MHIDDILKKGKTLINNKQSRSVFVLFITIFIVFALNSLLPVIEGSTHYTADATTMTYKEYKEKIQYNPNYRMTWASSKKVDSYVSSYVKAHPELTLDEQLLIEPPDGFKVDVYTKFFFQHPFWYMTTLINLISALLVYYPLFNFLITRRKLTYKKYVDLENELIKLNDESLDPVTFEPWIRDEFNRTRKINQHVSNVNYMIEKLEHKTPYKYKHLSDNSPYLSQYTDYCNKKQELLSLLEPEYIDRYVMDSDVKGFLYIYPTFVTGGHNMTGRTMDSFSHIKSNGQRIGKDSIKKIITSTMLTTVYATLLTITIINSTDKPWYWVVLNIITSITPLLMQIPMAFDYCDTYMEEQLITNLMARRTIAYLYLADMKARAEKEDQESAKESVENTPPVPIDIVPEVISSEIVSSIETVQAVETSAVPDTSISKEVYNEDNSTEGSRDSSISSNGGDSEEYSS